MVGSWRFALVRSLRSYHSCTGGCRLIRLDGHSFSKWTRGLRKPFDERRTLT